MEGSNEPRTVWVTGSGMGASHARRFASMGDRVGCWDVQAEALSQLAEEIRASGGQAEGVVVDVSDWAQVDDAAARLQEALGPASVVVANAGIVLTGEHVEDLDPTRVAARARGQPHRRLPHREGGHPTAARGGRCVADPDLVGVWPDHVSRIRRIQRLQARGNRPDTHSRE